MLWKLMKRIKEVKISYTPKYFREKKVRNEQEKHQTIGKIRQHFRQHERERKMSEITKIAKTKKSVK